MDEDGAGEVTVGVVQKEEGAVRRTHYAIAAAAQRMPEPAPAAPAQTLMPPTSPLLALALLLAPGLPWAQEIVRQRLPDGRILFTDRPQPGVPIEQRWSIEPEDPVAAQARREALQRESAAVSERLNRQATESRERELQAELARERAARAAAEREAARARADAAAEPARAIVWPARRLPPPHPALPPGGIAPPPPRERAIDRLIPPQRPPRTERSR